MLLNRQWPAADGLSSDAGAHALRSPVDSKLESSTISDLMAAWHNSCLDTCARSSASALEVRRAPLRAPRWSVADIGWGEGAGSSIFGAGAPKMDLPAPSCHPDIGDRPSRRAKWRSAHFERACARSLANVGHGHVIGQRGFRNLIRGSGRGKVAVGPEI